MPRAELEFADGFYVSQSGPYIEKRAVNVYPVIPDSQAVTKRALFHTPGISLLSTATGANSRGAIVFTDGTEYRVIGGSLWSISSTGTAADLGAISGGVDVSMASNGINIAIVDPSGDSYFYTPETSTLELSNSAAFLSFGQATSVTYKAGYYAYTTDEVFFSSSFKTTNAGKDFNALDFQLADVSPDKVVKSFNDHNQLYIMGESVTQVYRNIVTEGFPFQEIQGAMLTKGCAARNSVISFDNSFLFLGGGEGEKPGIYQALGSSVQKISTQSIDYLIHSNSEEDISNTRAFSYAEDGNYFAVFTVGNNTFTYDQTTSKRSGKHEWHERQTGVTNGRGFQKWRAIHGVKAYGEIHVGDDRSGIVGKLDKSIHTEYGDTLERFWTTRPFISDGDGVYSREIELVMETGLGNDDVEEPQIRMDYSDNGSRSFNSEVSRSLGKVGEYNTEVKWKRMGRFPNTRVMRWKITDPVPVNVYGLFANAEAPRGG